MLYNRKKRNPKEKDLLNRIKKDPLLQRKILRRLLFLLFLASVFYLYFGGNYGFLRILSLKKEKESIILETKRLQAQNMDLELEKEKLKNNPFYIEKVARERYGMAKEDEVIYKFIQPQDSSSTLVPKDKR
ncbi:MAG: septum formation initiator family protein [candidate division Zixibacteria bacterium]|nr:septum formation initiator family protein [candidate division Zixibacteria bacterium]